MGTFNPVIRRRQVNDLKVVKWYAEVTKPKIVMRRTEVDNLIEDVGKFFVAFFILIAVAMFITLILFSVGFFMAVTHWYDRGRLLGRCYWQTRHSINLLRAVVIVYSLTLWIYMFLIAILLLLYGPVYCELCRYLEYAPEDPDGIVIFGLMLIVLNKFLVKVKLRDDMLILAFFLECHATLTPEPFYDSEFNKTNSAQTDTLKMARKAPDGSKNDALRETQAQLTTKDLLSSIDQLRDAVDDLSLVSEDVQLADDPLKVTMDLLNTLAAVENATSRLSSVAHRLYETERYRQQLLNNLHHLIKRVNSSDLSAIKDSLIRIEKELNDSRATHPTRQPDVQFKQSYHKFKRTMVGPCRRTYDITRALFHELCGNIVDAGNAIWFGLAMYVISAIFLFFFALQLSHAVRVADNRVLPKRDAVVDLDAPPPPKEETVDSSDSLDAVDWRKRVRSYRLPGKTHADYLQEPEERQRRRTIIT